MAIRLTNVRDAQQNKRAVQRSHEKVKMFDHIFKQTNVMVTDQNVHDKDALAADSAAVQWFKNVCLR